MRSTYCVLIATDASGNTDLIKDGVNGFLFQDGDSKELAETIMLIDSNPLLAAQFVAKGKEIVNSFSIDATVRKYERFFYRLVDEYSPGKVGSITTTSVRSSKSY